MGLVLSSMVSVRVFVRKFVVVFARHVSRSKRSSDVQNNGVCCFSHGVQHASAFNDVTPVSLSEYMYIRSLAERDVWHDGQCAPRCVAVCGHHAFPRTRFPRSLLQSCLRSAQLTRVRCGSIEPPPILHFQAQRRPACYCGLVGYHGYHERNCGCYLATSHRIVCTSGSRP